MSGSGPSVSARSEGEQPVEGVRNPEDGWCRAVVGPGHTDPSAEAAVGAWNPRRGDPVLRDRGGHSSQNPERVAKPVGAAGWSSDHAAGRSAEYLVAVKTARRGRRTNVAATSDGALREAAEPCEGRPGDGDILVEQLSCTETPGGASTDLSVPTTGGACDAKAVALVCAFVSSGM
jgi:hypothetical protein